MIAVQIRGWKEWEKEAAGQDYDVSSGKSKISLQLQQQALRNQTQSVTVSELTAVCDRCSRSDALQIHARDVLRQAAHERAQQDPGVFLHRKIAVQIILFRAKSLKSYKTGPDMMHARRATSSGSSSGRSGGLITARCATASSTYACSIFLS